MSYRIREIQPEDDLRVSQIIKAVGEEFGAVGEGYGPSDSEVDAMSQHYSDQSCSRYFVAIVAGEVVGGGGIAAFNGSKRICELRKLFLLPASRGLGIGKKLTFDCLAYAKSKGYQSCYLDTLTNMKSAISLYDSLGFNQLDKPLEGTVHNGCDVWMLKEL